MERSLSAARKTSVEEADSEAVVGRVRQAIQRENDLVQSTELFSRNMVSCTLLYVSHLYLKHLFSVSSCFFI